MPASGAFAFTRTVFAAAPPTWVFLRAFQYAQYAAAASSSAIRRLTIPAAPLPANPHRRRVQDRGILPEPSVKQLALSRVVPRAGNSTRTKIVRAVEPSDERRREVNYTPVQLGMKVDAYLMDDPIAGAIKRDR